MRLAIFASGGGSNAGALFDAVERGTLTAEIAVLVVERENTGAAERARVRGVPVEIVAPDPDAAAFGETLLGLLARYEVGGVVLAGYLRKIPDPVVWAYRGRIVNVHPSLLPAFGGAGMYGRRVHEAVLAYGCRVSGATVHFVDAEYDTGPVILQQAVDVEPGDTPETLGAAVLAVEHVLLPRAVRLLAEGRLRLEGRLVHIEGNPEK